MAEEQEHLPQRRRKGRRDRIELNNLPPPAEVHPSIRNLRGLHRAAHPDMNVVLETSSHLLMACEWPINCPRFMDGLRMIGLDCVSRMQYIRLDQHLLTALVERWSSQTNSFHLPVGEMTITLQDVAMILGVQVDGPALIGSIVIGEGKRWQSWPDCCDELLGQHPIENVVYHDPINPNIWSTFTMGQANTKTCLPLRWLRWMFWRDSYIDLSEFEFHRHLRAYLLYIFGCFLLADTSGCEVHLQYLPLMEDLRLFSSYSLGGAVLAHLYRELHEATRPSRVKIAGCLHLMQVWSWEHLHVGRPTLLVPYPNELYGLSVGSRWNEKYVREMPPANLKIYRDELDGLLDSQVTWEPYEDEIINLVAVICVAGIQIWRCRVPLISWKRVEWHLPDRVIRQFGLLPNIEPLPMDPTFERKDGRGKADIDWVEFQQKFIAIWDDRRAYISSGSDGLLDQEQAISSYMRWYKSWASLYLLSAPKEPPRTYYSKAAGERAVRECLLNIEDAFRGFYGVNSDSPYQKAVDILEALCSDLRRNVYIPDTRYQAPEDQSFAPHDSPAPPSHYSSMEAGPSTYQENAPSSAQWEHTSHHSMGSQEFDQTLFSHNQGLESTPVAYVEAPDEQQPANEEHFVHHLRLRPLRAPDTYTPGSKAIPRRGRARKH